MKIYLIAFTLLFSVTIYANSEVTPIETESKKDNVSYSANKDKTLEIKLIVSKKSTANHVKLSVKKSDLNNLIYIIKDRRGKNIKSAPIKRKETKINTKYFEKGLYKITVKKNRRKVKTLTLVKK